MPTRPPTNLGLSHLKLKPRDRYAPRPGWPEAALDGPVTAFSPRPALPFLRVVIDAELLEVSTEKPTALGLLAGLLTHPYVDPLRYSDAGPPAANAERTSHGSEWYPGWLHVGSLDPQTGGRSLVFGRDDQVTTTAVIGNAEVVARADSENDAYRELGTDAAAEQRAADAVAVAAASAAGADVFLTRRPYLHSVTWPLARDVLVTRPESALGLVGLYLRAQNEFLVYRSPDGGFSSRMNRGLFYWVGTRALLPAGWRWFSAAIGRDSGDHAHIYLAQSALQRLQRALIARDEARAHLFRPPDNDSAEAALTTLDVVLVELLGALDACARVAEKQIGTGTDMRSVGWRRRRWMASVRKAQPELAGLVSDGGRHHPALGIIAGLRNCIHGEPLTALAISSRPSVRDGTLVGLPAAEGQVVAKLAERAGGAAAWGIRSVFEDRVHLEPAVLVDRLLAEGSAMLNDLMAATPVEGFEPGPDDGPPVDDDTFSQFNQQYILWQLALPDSVQTS